MNRQHIVDEIRRTAEANNGVPLGWRRFETETGIKLYDWYGAYWAKWGDAVREAGFEPNRMTESYDDGFLVLQTGSSVTYSTAVKRPFVDALGARRSG